MITDHITLDRLGDLVDGGLPVGDVHEIERHVADCAACRDELARFRALLERTASLPRHLEPPADSWDGIRAAVTSQRAGRAWTRWPAATGWGLRAAATLLLVVGTSALTVLVLRWRDAAPGPNSSVATVEAVYGGRATVRAVDESYAAVVDELTTTLRAQRDALAPETVATLERTLRVIDDAIAEARTALAADPGNSALLDVLSANYEQKVELLRRASELPART